MSQRWIWSDKITNERVARVGYLQVNALSEWIIGIYLHEFTNNEREISIPHEAGKFWVHC